MHASLECVSSAILFYEPETYRNFKARTVKRPVNSQRLAEKYDDSQRFDVFHFAFKQERAGRVAGTTQTFGVRFVDVLAGSDVNK